MEFLFPKYTSQISSLVQRANAALSSIGQRVNAEDGQHTKVRLVFAGQYSAGKSTILRMLTGRKDIAIGAGITTQKSHSYEWNGLEVIDTPGIHTELRPDHDEISYKAIASADMLVFVLSNELFDSHLADHFRKLAIDKDKAGEMILVVNKMDRASDGNTPDQQEIIRNDLRGVLAPYTPEQLNLCFLDAESYLDSLSERETDPELADELLERSGYTQFIQTLNAFVEEKGLPSKATTILYRIVEQLQRAIRDIEPRIDDEDIAALEGHYLEQRHIFVSTRNKLQNDISDLYTTASNRIRELGLDAANLLVPGCNQEEVEQQLSGLVREYKQITEQCQRDSEKLVDDQLTKMDQHLEGSDSSEFTQELEARLSGRFETLPEILQKMLVGAGPGLQKAGLAVADKAYRSGVTSGLKLSNFSGSTIHDQVLKIGHALHHKFKPWEAVKWTKGVAIGGRILGAFGVALSVFMQMNSDHEENKARIELQRNRQNIRSQFNCAADAFYNFGKKYIQDCVDSPLSVPISEIDDGLRKIRDTRTHQNETLRSLEEVQRDCQSLIQSIHQEYSEQICFS